MSETKHLLFEVEIPGIYTDDLEELMRVDAEDSFLNDSERLLNCIGEPGIVRLRTEISGEKDSEVIEVWGSIREARLVEPSRGYGDGPHLTDEQLEKHGVKLLRDEDSCEWCMSPNKREVASG